MLVGLKPFLLTFDRYTMGSTLWDVEILSDTANSPASTNLKSINGSPTSLSKFFSPSLLCW